MVWVGVVRFWLVWLLTLIAVALLWFAVRVGGLVVGGPCGLVFWGCGGFVIVFWTYVLISC